jgi:hypothetical protein
MSHPDSSRRCRDMLKTLSKATALATAAVMVWGATALADLPENQSISINGGAATTANLSATVTVAVVHCPPNGDLKGLEVAFSNTATGPWTIVHAENANWPGSDPDGCTGETPTSPTTNFAWTLASGGSGERTVYARFRHGSDVVSAQDSITFQAPPSDTTAPVVTVTPPTPDGDNGWFVTKPVTVGVSATDASGIASVNCTPSFTETSSTATSKSGTVSVTDEGTTTVSCTATDGATPANTSSAVTADVKIDTVAPSITDGSFDSGTAGSNGWYTSAVLNKFSASDGTSGLADCAANFTKSSGTSEEGSSVKIASGSCKDNAGNVNPGIESSAYKIDLSDPYGITWTGGPSDGASYYFGSVPSAPTCDASDDVSGLASCAVTGYSNAVGNHTMTATATDNAGRTATAQRSYTVLAWTLGGFYAPVDKPNTLNVTKGGSTVPLKFEVFAGTTELTDTAVVKTFVTGISCTAGSATDAIEQYATGNTSLRYDATAGQFVFNWKTLKQPGTCWAVKMETQDGSFIEAYFNLK